jgi:hypothetical protein
LKIFTNNRKTILSLDFERERTCPTICSYCYVKQTETLYPAYSRKIVANYELAMKNPDAFATELNLEYKKAKRSKSKTYSQLHKLPVRIYGSGDYIPQHLKFISKLDFKYYIISKSLTMSTMSYHRKQLLMLPKLTKLVLSFDADNLTNYTNVKNLFGKDRIGFSFTGTTNEFVAAKQKGYKFTIFFNTEKNKKSILNARKHKEQCPCDTKLIPSAGACTKCNKCWRSSVKLS